MKIFEVIGIIFTLAFGLLFLLIFLEVSCQWLISIGLNYYSDETNTKVFRRLSDSNFKKLCEKIDNEARRRWG